MLVGKEDNSLNLIIFIYSIINIRILRSSMQIWTLKYMTKKQLSKFENIFESMNVSWGFASRDIMSCFDQERQDISNVISPCF